MNESGIIDNQITFISPPEPVGYWSLYGNEKWTTRFAMYQKPTEQQIKNTEKLLGWVWIEGKAQEK